MLGTHIALSWSAFKNTEHNIYGKKHCFLTTTEQHYLQLNRREREHSSLLMIVINLTYLSNFFVQSVPIVQTSIQE